ncbi:glycosyltransferase family A protein [Flavobacterium sp.]|uniref:glycosyltransferase family A protein n=1 Tax=Flavobacterium sp. TaxID=239 RepID=UPI003527F03C
MIFKFLKYTRPIWYFNLKPSQDFGYFPTEEQLTENGFTFSKDLNYLSKDAQNRDLAWVAHNSGFINQRFESGLTIWNKANLPVIDEYRFMKKYLHPAWVFYTYIIRVLTFHNPFKETYCFLKNRKVKRVSFSNTIVKQNQYDEFESKLVSDNPKISVIIPTLNRYKYLRDVMLDLEKQTYKNFEVIVVDQTEPFQEEFYKNWNLDLIYWHQKEKALWKARNEAIEKASGDYILLYDDDSLIEADWIYEHLKCLDFFKADISSGVSLSVVGAKVPEHYNYFSWSSQLDTGNVLLKKEIFYKIGFFDLKFEKQRMGDGEFGLRCYLNGYKNISNCKAKRVHLKVSEGGLRQMGSWDGWRPKKLFGPRPVPSVLYLSRKYFGNSSTVYYIMNSILPSLIPYKFKGNRFLIFLSFLFLPLVLPLVVFQVFKSWKISSRMLS